MNMERGWLEFVAKRTAALQLADGGEVLTKTGSESVLNNNQWVAAALAMVAWGVGGAYAQAPASEAVHAIAKGSDQDVNYFTRDDYCEQVFIRKNGSQWEVLTNTASSLVDDNVERLRACIGYMGKEEDRVERLNAVVFTVDVKDTCEVYRRCANGPASSCNYRQQYDAYRYEAERSKGYYACNSQFAKRNIFGTIDFEMPISPKALQSALEQPALQAAAQHVMASRQAAILDIALHKAPKRCEHFICDVERRNTRFVVEHMSGQVSAADLQQAAAHHLIMTGTRTVPDWMAERLSPEAAAQALELARADWHSRYQGEVRGALWERSSRETVEGLIRRLQSQTDATWAAVDFDHQLPQLHQRLSAIAAQEQAQRDQALAAEQQRQQQLAQQLQAWRQTVRVGSNTFCGPVIEVRPPMVKIAIRVPLTGYSNEAWLNVNELYSPNYGCLHRNGRLFPQ